MSTISHPSVSILDKPSQWLNFGYVVLTVCGFIIPPLGLLCFFFLLWKILVVHFWKWEITGDSIIETKGVLNVNIDEVQLFMIKDVRLYEPFLYRLVGLSKLYLVTSDKYRPVLVLDGIRDGKAKRAMFKNMALTHRKKEGVREFDFR